MTRTYLSIGHVGTKVVGMCNQGVIFMANTILPFLHDPALRRETFATTKAPLQNQQSESGLPFEDGYQCLKGSAAASCDHMILTIRHDRPKRFHPQNNDPSLSCEPVQERLIHPGGMSF